MPALAALLHDDATPIVVSASRINGNGQTIWFNEIVRDAAAADRFAAHLAASGRNVYCKHAYHDGATHILNDRVRPDCKAEHFPKSRSFFIDIDVGPKRPYPTMKAAGAALQTALHGVKNLGLPTPNLVQLTGGGLQVVWATVTAYVQSEWRRLTGILFLLMRKFKLDIDQNLSSINRGVRYCGEGFWNVSHGAPRTTRILSFNAKRIPNAIFQTVLDENGKLRSVPKEPPQPSKYHTPSADPFDIPSDFKLDLSLIIDECKVLQEAILTGGKDHDYDHWKNLIALCAKNHDKDYGRELAHAISKDYPDYDADQTDGKFDSFLTHEKPTLCRTLEKSCPKNLCTTCAYYRQINSPGGIQGKMAAVARAQGVEEAAATSQILDGFYFNSEKGIRRKKIGDEATHPVIWPGVTLLGIDLQRDDRQFGREILIIQLRYGDTQEYNVVMDVGRVGSVAKLTETLGTQAIVLDVDRQKGVQKAMVAWIDQLKRRTETRTHHTRLGWTDDAAGFVLGRRLYTPRLIKPISPIPALLEHETHGDQDEYMRLVGDIMRDEHRPEAHAMLAASLSAPLLHLIGAPGIAHNFYSERSGHGKSTLAKLAISFWGRPGAMTFNLDDTINAVMKRLGQLNNIPGVWDDIQIDPYTQKLVGDILFRLTSTKEKNRLGPGMVLDERGQWLTPLLFTSNQAFLDITRATRGKRNEEASIARLLDFRMPALPANSFQAMARVMAATALLDTHCGWMGHLFIPYVVNHRVYLTNEIQKVATLLMARAEKTMGGMASRNHAAAGACMITAARIAEEAIGFPIRRAYVTKAIATAIDTIRVARKAALVAADPLNVVRDYMAANARHGVTLVRSAGNKTDIDLSRLQPLRPFKYQIDLPAKEILIPVQEFLEWLSETGKPLGRTMEDLTDYRAKELRRLCEPVKTMRGPYTEMLSFPSTGPLAGYFED